MRLSLFSFEPGFLFPSIPAFPTSFSMTIRDGFADSISILVKSRLFGFCSHSPPSRFADIYAIRPPISFLVVFPHSFSKSTCVFLSFSLLLLFF